MLTVQNDIERGVQEMVSWTPEKREEFFSSNINDLRKTIVQIAQVVGAMEEAGDDVRLISTKYTVPMNFISQIKRVRTGALLPDIMVKFHGSLRTKIASLILNDQQKMAEGEKVRLLVLKDDNTVDFFEQEPSNLTPAQIRQIFGDGVIRDDAQQRAWIEEQRAKKFTPEDEPIVTLDQKTKHVVVSKPTRISKKDLINYLAALQ